MHLGHTKEDGYGMRREVTLVQISHLTEEELETQKVPGPCPRSHGILVDLTPSEQGTQTAHPGACSLGFLKALVFASSWVIL